MSDSSRNYENFIELRKRDSSFIWTSRKLNPQLAYYQGIPRPTPIFHKQNVLNSPRIQELLDNISKKQNVSKLVLEEKVLSVLDEIGYNKNLKVIRWLGLVLVEICLRMSTGIYVNVDNLLKLKTEMGNCPVIFVPSHRSYADFILMSYLCFTYDIEIPAIAAGMDFHGMWGMGNMLRDTGAFFMRRSYNDDDLYWAVFKQYIYQLVTKGDLPIEFFIEGTRSRSNKSLIPKYGLISMILKAFFFGEVPDIKFVPINISYDRILEESLFAFELLGVPKPKESTSGFFKSLKVIKENFGKIYFHFGQPISAKRFFGDKLERSVHNMGPLHVQEMTEKEKAVIPSLAHTIVHTQQKCGVINVFNLVALILNDNLVNSKELLTVKELIEEVYWLKDVIQKLGAFVYTENIENSVDECFVVHKNLIEVQPNNRIRLVHNNIILDKIHSSKLKAHSLSEKCMTFSVPFVMLQMYINPSLHYFLDVALIVVILKYQQDLDAVNSQKILEDKINNGNEFVHPYSLNLDSLTNCLNVLVTLGALSKTRSRNKITYEIRRQEIVPIKEKLRNYMSYCCSEDSCIKMKYLKNKL
ncbi:dihydroxyacetone phosphate acyltransferase isoform X2 [Anoplophora glabripennis]|uniref:dihydroxyacetone phosphate acyltransferase isoform X2 n=1 Tax=Anoplophora glabripennis TaxID=217634 RepID=UPI00087429C8|nr:dihydroxyacetone phosphate acyltransferase isoform X2 [Anoplophora glabripennis]